MPGPHVATTVIINIPQRGPCDKIAIFLSNTAKKRFAEANLNMVGVKGFEPSTSCSRSMRATKLRYTPL